MVAHNQKFLALARDLASRRVRKDPYGPEDFPHLCEGCLDCEFALTSQKKTQCGRRNVTKLRERV